jgi:hypothetical protein
MTDLDARLEIAKGLLEKMRDSDEEESLEAVQAYAGEMREAVRVKWRTGAILER